MANSDDAPSARPEDAEEIESVADLGDEEIEQESEEEQESRLRRGMREALHAIESRTIRIVFWCLLFPIGLAAGWLIVSVTVHLTLPKSWMSDEQLEALLPAALALKDAATGAVSGSALTAWFIYRRLRNLK